MKTKKNPKKRAGRIIALCPSVNGFDILAIGSSIPEVDKRVRAILQLNYEGLWEGKYCDTFIGSRSWLAKKGWHLTDYDLENRYAYVAGTNPF